MSLCGGGRGGSEESRGRLTGNPRSFSGVQVLGPEVSGPMAAGQPLPGPAQPQNQGGDRAGEGDLLRLTELRMRIIRLRGGGKDQDTPGFAQGAPSKTQIPFVIP